MFLNMFVAIAYLLVRFAKYRGFFFVYRSNSSLLIAIFPISVCYMLLFCICMLQCMYSFVCLCVYMLMYVEMYVLLCVSVCLHVDVC